MTLLIKSSSSYFIRLVRSRSRIYYAQNQDVSAYVWADSVLRTTSQWPTVTYLKVILASCGTNPEIKKLEWIPKSQNKTHV